MSWIGLAMLAVAGFLLGGVVSAWRRSRSLAVVLGIGTALAVASGVAWLLCSRSTALRLGAFNPVAGRICVPL